MSVQGNSVLLCYEENIQDLLVVSESFLVFNPIGPNVYFEHFETSRLQKKNINKKRALL